MPDEASERVEVPTRIPRQHHEQVRLRTAGLKHGNAALRRFKELTCAAERESKRLLRVPDISELGAQPVEELEGGEFPLDRRPCRAISIVSARAAVKAPAR